MEDLGHGADVGGCSDVKTQVVLGGFVHDLLWRGGMEDGKGWWGW